MTEAPMTLFGGTPVAPADDADPVLGAYEWPTNGHLILDVARLGYLEPTDDVIDVTYGKGMWWTLWRPDNLTGTDIDPAKSQTGESVNFLDLPYPDGRFDAVAFDPPYIAQGGRETSTLPDFLDRFGLVDVPKTCADTQALIDGGLAECARVVKPRGVILVKCKDYINGGELWPGSHFTLAAGLALGLELEDRFEFLRRPGPQPSTNRDGSKRRQLHARRNHSTLFVLRAPSSRIASS